MKVYIVGAGSGKWDLISVRGLNILKQADVIIYDYLIDKNIFCHTNNKAELISCAHLGKTSYADSKKSVKVQHNINQLIVDYAKKGKKVVRLKGGDVSVFSRISEELDYLNEYNISFEIVPGITSGCIASAYAGIALTARNLSSDVLFLSGYEKNFSNEATVNWQSAAGCSTIVIYMGVKHISKISDFLTRFGKPKDTPVYCVSNVAGITQVDIVSNLKNISEATEKNQINPPAIFIIGELVNLNKKFGWFKQSRKILYTGLSEERFFLDGLFFHVPMIQIKPLDNYQRFDSCLTCIEKYDWIVFTSRYGVDYFFKRFNSLGFDSRRLKGIKIAVIGNSTKNKLNKFGLNPDLIPAQETSAGLLAEFSKINVKNRRIFIPRSDLSSKGIPDGLRKIGAAVTDSIAYKNVIPNDLPDINFDFFDEIFFTSPSTVRNFITQYANPPKHLDIKCIGSATYKEAKKWNIID
ncbi:uroporphyrinogen-III C-methyltransferase [bacterium]|nr:uroporphyrinogen-III C-methyltransferase [bacterium]